MAASGAGRPLTFEEICAAANTAATGRALPTAVLVATLEDEIRVLVYIVKCRSSGFMVILPFLDDVREVLTHCFLDGEGSHLVLYHEAVLPFEDAKGRKFGQGKVFLADFADECAGSFTRTPALRGGGPPGMLRLLVEGAVARPAVKGALNAAAEWIGDVADTDEGLQEYFTPEETGDLNLNALDGVAPVANGAPPDADVVAQLQARVVQLEAALAADAPAQAPVVDLEPAPRRAGRGSLFDMPNAGALDETTLARLRQAAGPAPKRLGRTPLAQLADPPQAVQHGLAEVDAGVAEEGELMEAIGSAPDPLHRLLALQMRQTAALVQKLTPQRDPISAALGSESGSSTSGVKGCVARDAFLKAMDDIPSTGKVIAANAAADLGLMQNQITGGMMRNYVEQRMALGDHKVLTYLAQFMAVGWQMSFEENDHFAMGILARGLMMIEQMSLDQGRCQFAWLLSGMPEPNLQLISMHRKKLGMTPYAKLAAASWVAGNVAYVKDMDYLENRLRNPKTADPADRAAPADEDQPPRGSKKPWRPKKKAQKEKPEAAEAQ